MQKPSTVFPVQEAIQFSENRHYFAKMPTPDPGYKSLTLQRMPDGRCVINGQNDLSEVERLDMLRALTQQLEAQIKQKAQECSSSPDTQTTTVSQPTDDCDGFPTKPLPGVSSNTYQDKPLLKISSIFPTVETVSTSVEENTPTDSQKPCFGNFEKTDLLADILKQTGIEDTKPWEEFELGSEAQVTLGIECDKAPAAEQEYASPENLPVLEVFQDANVDQDFEIEHKDIDEIMKQDPYMNNVIEETNTYTSNFDDNQQPEVLNLGDFQGSFAIDDNEENDMGTYRNPPSVSSIVSNSTYTSVLSPQPEFEVLEESEISMPQRATGLRGTRRRTSGGKGLKRLSTSGPRPFMSSSGKPHPTATALNGKLSRVQVTDYAESALHAHWWNMLWKVEAMLAKNIDYKTTKVEDLRKICHDLFAVAMFIPSDWGNAQKRKGIYKTQLREKYGWNPDVPFCSLNNGPKNADNGDAPRAKKDDLVQITPYLVHRYIENVRPFVTVRENGQFGLVPLPPLKQAVLPAFDCNSPALIVPKVEPTDATEEQACDFPSSGVAGNELSNYIVTETGGNSTVDMDELMEVLGNNASNKAVRDVMGNNLLTTSTCNNFDNLRIVPRQTDEQMDTDDAMTYPNPEMKAGSEKKQCIKVEHSYSMPDDDEVAKAKMQGMTTYQDSSIPGTVLELAEGNLKSATQAQSPLDQNTYFVQKLAELHPDLFDNIMKSIETESTAVL